MGLTDRNQPQSFEEMANAEEREVKSEAAEVTETPETEETTDEPTE